MWFSKQVNKQRGFLANCDPIENTGNIHLDEFCRDIPNLLEKKELRKKVNSEFIVVEYPDAKNEHLDALMRSYAFLASAYIHEDTKAPATELPASIAVPLSVFAKKLDRPPVLAYDSYCLCNWKRIDKTKGVHLGNIKLIQNFLGGEDEDWFILVHVDIEAKAAKIIEAIDKIRTNVFNYGTAEKAKEGLLTLAEGMSEVNTTMARMPEHCSPEIYFWKVRPYIFGFENVIFKGVEGDKAFSCRGETGAQSSLVPAMVAVLGIKHVDTKLTEHLLDMRKYMPHEHRTWLNGIDENKANQNKIHRSIRTYIATQIHKVELKDAYNWCVEELLRFRTTHLQYAIEYINKKVDKASGTGSTPYLAWLSQLRDETKAHLMS